MAAEAPITVSPVLQRGHLLGFASQSRIHKLEGHFICLHIYYPTAICAHV